jgi:hypothetical protein
MKSKLVRLWLTKSSGTGIIFCVSLTVVTQDAEITRTEIPNLELQIIPRTRLSWTDQYILGLQVEVTAP